MKTRNVLFFFIMSFLFQLPIPINGQTNGDHKLIVDGIVFEYENPSDSQIKEWMSKYKDICLRVIERGNYKIPKLMEEKDPCLVYLILKAKSLEEDNQKQTWFNLYSLMKQDQINKLYDILYREIYELALINEKYEALRLGIKYYNGEGVSQDYAKAFSYFSKAADMGSAAAQNNLGWMYYEGKHFEQDYHKAYDYFKMAADRGNIYAVGNLGMMYYYGQYVQKDPQKAFDLLKKASESDDPPGDAMRVLSACYRYGVGTTIDNEKAEYWLKKSAEYGDNQAKMVLENRNER